MLRRLGVEAEAWSRLLWELMAHSFRTDGAETDMLIKGITSCAMQTTRMPTTRGISVSKGCFRATPQSWARLPWAFHPHEPIGVLAANDDKGA